MQSIVNGFILGFVVGLVAGWISYLATGWLAAGWRAKRSLRETHTRVVDLREARKRGLESQRRALQPRR